MAKMLSNGLGVRLLKKKAVYGYQCLKGDKRPDELKHKWEINSYFYDEPREEFVKRDGESFIEAHDYKICYSVEERITHLILTCYCNIEGLIVQPTYNSETALKYAVVDVKNFPKYEIRYDEVSDTATVYREGKLLEEVEWFEISYNGMFPMITMSLVGEITYNGF